jgi:hypothetical protein
VATTPRRVSVWFSEPVDIRGTSLAVFDATGAQVDQRDSAADRFERNVVAVSLPPDLPDGIYTVMWKALTGDDAGRTSGQFQFGVGDVTPAAAPATSVPRGGVDAGITIEAPIDGGIVRGSDVPLAIDVSGVTLIGMGSGETPKPGTLGGHLHVAVDGAMVGMVASGQGLVLHNLATGAHEIVVTLAAPNHLPYEPPIEARARVSVGDGAPSGPVALSGGGMPGPSGPSGPVSRIAARLPAWPVTAGLLLAAVFGLGWLATALTSRRGASRRDLAHHAGGRRSRP